MNPPTSHQTKTAEKTAPKSAKSSSEEVVMSWAAPEFIKHEKGKIWFAIAGVLIVLLVLYAMQTASWTMAVAFIVLAGVYYLSQHHEPRNVEVKITTLAVIVGKKRIPFNHIKAFWVIYQPPHVKVLKLLTTEFMGEVTIQLDGQAPGPVRSYLMKQVPEYEGKGESFVDILIRLFRL